MRVTRGLHLFLVLMALSTAIVFTSTADAQTIYALLIIDDGNPSNAPQHNASKNKMERVFRNIKQEAGIPIEMFELKSNIDDDNPEYMSRDNILKWVRNVNADRDDVVFVYFSGHGGAHRTSRELYLTLPTGKFNRKELANAIDSIPCRLKILTTDACSYGVPIQLPYINSVEKAYANLFLEHKGFLNVAAAVEGEFALGNSEGGIFTRAFVDIMTYVDKLDDDGFVSWSEVFEETTKKTDFYFQALMNSPTMPQDIKDTLNEVNQKSQRPKYFGELPKRFSRAAD